jgi:phosphotriesterase-related protein
MHRKDFLKGIAASASLISAGIFPGHGYSSGKAVDDTIMTTAGSVSSTQMGFTLVHEHILSIFGTDAQEPAEYDEGKTMQEVVPYLGYIKSLGVDTIVDCSAAYLGRNVRLLNKIAEQANIQIITNTGLYGAADDRYVPDYAYNESADQLAKRWIDEFENDIQQSNIKPGFIKIGVDGGRLSEIDAKLVRAAALTHLETGLLMQIHTSGNTTAANEQLDILKEEGAHPNAWVWVHAQNTEEVADLVTAARKGAWISLDGLRSANYLNSKRDGESSLMEHYRMLQSFKEEELLHRILLSHDGSSFPPPGSAKRPMDVLSNAFIPMLKAGGFSDIEIDQITNTNPARAFAIKIRKG